MNVKLFFFFQALWVNSVFFFCNLSTFSFLFSFPFTYSDAYNVFKVC